MTLITRREKQQVLVICARVLARAQAWCLSAAGDGEPVWVDTQGRVSTYSQLGDRHLRNIISLLEREEDTESEVYQNLKKEWEKRNKGRKPIRVQRW